MRTFIIVSVATASLFAGISVAAAQQQPQTLNPDPRMQTVPRVDPNTANQMGVTAAVSDAPADRRLTTPNADAGTAPAEH